MSRIGQVVMCKSEHMGVPICAIGIVFDEYVIGNDDGVQVIWQNGEYCGYSRDEEPSFYDKTQVQIPLNYQFTNVIKLREDFLRGNFHQYFEEAAKQLLPESWRVL